MVKTCYLFRETVWVRGGYLWAAEELSSPSSQRKETCRTLRTGDRFFTGDWDLCCPKVLATRIKKVMEHIIHVDQTYCVPSRLISDNIFLVRDILDLSGSLDCELGLISLDQEKAFDWVEHQFLWQTQGCFLSGMLYWLAIEPFLHKLRLRLCGVSFPDDVIVFVKKKKNNNNMILMFFLKLWIILENFLLLKLTGERVKL